MAFIVFCIWLLDTYPDFRPYQNKTIDLFTKLASRAVRHTFSINTFYFYFHSHPNVNILLIFYLFSTHSSQLLQLLLVLLLHFTVTHFLMSCFHTTIVSSYWGWGEFPVPNPDKGHNLYAGVQCFLYWMVTLQSEKVNRENTKEEFSFLKET